MLCRRCTVCSPAHTWCLHIGKYQECSVSNQSFCHSDLSTLWPTHHSWTQNTWELEVTLSSQSIIAHGVKHLLLCPDSPISTLNKSYILLMEAVSAQHGCPAITISNNNGNWSPSLPITQNTFNHCRQKKKKDQYVIFQLFQHIGLSSSVADFTSKISEVF